MVGGALGAAMRPGRAERRRRVGGSASSLGGVGPGCSARAADAGGVADGEAHANATLAMGIDGAEIRDAGGQRGVGTLWR